MQEAKSHIASYLGIAALTFALAGPSYAQDSRSGRLVGTVIDSVFVRPLAGVRVVAVGAGDRANVQGAATTDSIGRYHIDSLPAGRYAVGLESPLLDSLEITVSPREVTVTSGAAATVDLALPPAAKLLAAVCPGVTLPPQTGAIVGHVVSAENEGSLPGVTIAMSWREVGFDRATLRPTNQERIASVVTDDGGWYRACGVPTGGWLSMQLQRDGRIGPVLRTFVDDTLGLAVRHLSFSSTAARAISDSSLKERPSADSLSAGTAKLTGTVLSPEGAPVAEAEVRVLGTAASARTDAQGSYALATLPAGTQMLAVRRVGYAVLETNVDLREGVTTTRVVRLQRIMVNLDSVRIVAVRTKYPEFSANKARALFGTFLGPEELERQHVSFPSDIIEKIPGFEIIGTDHRAIVRDMRGMAPKVVHDGRSMGGSCPVNIVVDGAEGFQINDVAASDIGAIEVYHVGVVSPVQFDRGCGVIMIWTKR